MRIDREVVIIDEGCQRISRWDLQAPEPRWMLDSAGYPLARDLQVLDPRAASGADLLVGFDRGWMELDSTTGRVLKVVDRWQKVTSVRRRPSGQTLVAGLDLDGAPGVVVVTLDAQDHVVRTDRREGDYIRLMRPLDDGGFLLCMDWRIVETGGNLETRRELVAPGFRHAWLPKREDDGSTTVSGGYGGFMARFDPEGRLVKTFGRAEELPPEVAVKFYASWVDLDDGILAANWQGHGPDCGSRGRQLVRFDKQGSFVDSWSRPDFISSAQGLILAP